MINNVSGEGVGKILLLQCEGMHVCGGGGRYKRKEIPLVSGARKAHRAGSMPWGSL